MTQYGADNTQDGYDLHHLDARYAEIMRVLFPIPKSDGDRLMTDGALVRSVKLQKLIAAVEASFRHPRLVVVGDAPAEEAQYDREVDAVREIVGADRG